MGANFGVGGSSAGLQRYTTSRSDDENVHTRSVFFRLTFATISVMPEPLLFPMFLKLAGRRCVVVGAGPLAEAKIDSLLVTGASVVVLAPQATDRVQTLADQGKLEWVKRVFADRDVEAAFLVVAATNSKETNRVVAGACRRFGVLCNAVDDPEECDFFYGAVVRRGALQIAISTGGSSPALARRLREQLQQQFGPEYEAWLLHVAANRRKILSASLPANEKQAALERLASQASFEEYVAARGKDETGKY